MLSFLPLFLKLDKSKQSPIGKFSGHSALKTTYDTDLRPFETGDCYIFSYTNGTGETVIKVHPNDTYETVRSPVATETSQRHSSGCDSSSGAIFGLESLTGNTMGVFAMGIGENDLIEMRSYPIQLENGGPMPFVAISTGAGDVFNPGDGSPGYSLTCGSDGVCGYYRVSGTKGPELGFYTWIPLTSSQDNIYVVGDLAFHPDSTDPADAVYYSIDRYGDLIEGRVNFVDNTFTSKSLGLVSGPDLILDGANYSWHSQYFDSNKTLNCNRINGEVSARLQIPSLNDPTSHISQAAKGLVIPTANYYDGAYCLTHTTTTTPPPEPFECPAGHTLKNVSLEYVHVQDFSSVNENDGDVIRDQLIAAFTELDSRMNGTANFAFVRAVDKNLDGLTAECNDFGASLSPNNDELLMADLDKLTDVSNFVDTGARPDMFDPVLHQLNTWAAAGSAYNAETGETVIRIIGINTDQCPRVAGLWYKIPEEKQAQWTEDRGLVFPLTGGIIADCQDHDYPTLEEATIEASRNSASMIFMINGDPTEQCQNADKYIDNPDVSNQLTKGEWWDLTTSKFTNENVTTIEHTSMYGMATMSDIIVQSVTEILCKPLTTTSTTTKKDENITWIYSPPVQITTEAPTGATSEEEISVGVIVGSSIGAILIVAACTGGVCIAIRRKKRNKNQTEGMEQRI